MNGQDLPEETGNCKQLSTAKPDDEGLWYKRYPGRFLKATMDMPYDLRASYALFIDYYFYRGGPLVNDDNSIARGLGCDVRKWKHTRKQLFALRKLTLGSDGLIHNAFADEILKERSTKLTSDRRSRKGKSVPRKATTPGTGASTGGSTGTSTDASTTPDLGEKTNVINATPGKIPLHARASIKIEEEDSKKETTPPEAQSVVMPITLADQVLTPDIRARFYKVASTFGMKPDTIAFPPPKEQSDELLRDVANVGLAEADDLDMAITAFCDGLTAMQTSDMEAKSKGQAGRYGSGGVPAAIKYLGKCLRDKVANVKIDRAKALAKARTEEAVQTKIAQVRLNGIGRKRADQESWEDAAAAL